MPLQSASMSRQSAPKVVAQGPAVNVEGGRPTALSSVRYSPFLVDPRKPGGQIRGAVDLPAGTGKAVRVAAFGLGPDELEAAAAAGADVAGGDELIARAAAKRAIVGSGSPCASRSGAPPSRLSSASRPDGGRSAASRRTNSSGRKSAASHTARGASSAQACM